MCSFPCGTEVTFAVSAMCLLTASSVEDPYDYQGRSFLHAPQDLSVDLRSDEPPAKCFIPKKLLHTWCVGGESVCLLLCSHSFTPDVLDIHLLLSVFTPCPLPVILPPSYFFSLLPPLSTSPSSLLPFLHTSIPYLPHLGQDTQRELQLSGSSPKLPTSCCQLEWIVRLRCA